MGRDAFLRTRPRPAVEAGDRVEAAVHQNELRAHPNVLQVRISALKEPDVRSLIVAAADAIGVTPALPSDDVIRTIGGHPGLARATAALVAQKGPALLDANPSDVFSLQEELLGESLDFANRSAVERDALALQASARLSLARADGRRSRPR